MKRSVAHSLLGILSLRAMSGYDIRKFVKEHIGYFWKESYGQIYPMLKRMAAQGLVEARTERNSGKPDRQVYSLTQAGHVELQAWLGQPPAAPSPRNELLLKLFFGHRSKSEDAIRHVTEFRRGHEGLLQQYSQVEKWLKREHANHPGLPYWLMTLDYGRGYSRMAVDWSEATLRALQRLAKSAQNPSPRKEPKRKRR
jgi:PadR family transcriptional regulator AphA